MGNEKTVPAANSGDLAAMMQGLLGVGTGSKQTTTQNTGALQDVLAQLNGIDPSAQLATLFQQAQAKIPQIAAAKAGSGSRTPGGTLDPQMQKLLSQITLAAQQQMSQQQLQKAEIATRAAQGVANGSTQVTQTPQASSMQKVMQALTVAQGTGKMFGVDLGQEGGKKLRELFGIGGAEAALPFGGQLGFSLPTPGIPSLAAQFAGGGMPSLGGNMFPGGDFSPSMSFGSDFSGFSDFSSFNMPDFSSSFSFGDVSSAPSLNFSDVSFGSGGGGFGSGLDFGSFPSGTEGAGASFSTGLSSGGPSIMPLFSAANYLINPEKISDAFELGEGNVLGDISQLAGLGSTIGGVGGLLGAGLGGLAGLAGPLGLIAMFGGVLADVFGDDPWDNATFEQRAGYTAKMDLLEDSVYQRGKDLETPGYNRKSNDVENTASLLRLLQFGQGDSPYLNYYSPRTKEIYSAFKPHFAGDRAIEAVQSPEATLINVLGKDFFSEQERSDLFNAAVGSNSGWNEWNDSEWGTGPTGRAYETFGIAPPPPKPDYGPWG